MSNGLMMTIDEFRSLPQKEKLDCLYLNQVKTLELIRGYKLYYRITTIIGSVLVVGMGLLFKMSIGI